ncbi:DUF6266 family protein [Pedobacter africanus]|uniref:Uncharacterized protein n=1 Tax=Pedobacter africanus TaxID=151894 RepID=A0A1W2EEQ9_9SPHI|nr:DUF6266 family protein [Pedobacter africanus]SMD08223.1 hypothetical protein SAMN04488524_4734 [Pedobacter africanus]
MGKLSRGFLGGFQGQMGTGYGCFWRQMDLIKAMPRKVKRPPTAAQLPVQLKFTLMTSFLKRLGRVVKVGFQNAASNQSGMNAAVKYNIEKAITGTSPNFTINFAELKFSDGTLPEALGANVVVDTPATVKYSWASAPVGFENGEPTDKATFVVYNPDKDKFVILSGVIARSALAYNLSVLPDWAGDEVHCYMSMTSADGKLVGNSQYLGPFTLL